MSNLFEKASEIRQKGEKWQDAIKRAKLILSSEKGDENKNRSKENYSKRVDYLRDKTSPIS